MSLQVWLPLNGDLRNQGLIDASFSNSNATIDTAGKIGSCYSFNGTDAQIYAVHDKSIWNNKPMTLCAWFKYVEGSTRAHIIDVAADLVLSYEKNDSGLYFKYWRSYTNSNGARAGEVHGTLPNYYDVNAWHHVAYVAENNLNYIYVDGALALTFESSLYTSNFKPLLGSTYNRVSIAKSQGDSLFASGLVNDVRVYDNALSPLEVKHLAQGLVLHYPLNRGGFGQENLATQYVVSGSNNPTNTGSAARTVYIGDYSIQIPATENADTYFSIYYSKPLEVNKVYTLSAYVSGLIDNSYYVFPLFAQNNYAMGGIRFDHNGLCKLTFTMTYTGTIPTATVNGNTVYRMFMDDNGRTIASGQGPITISHIKLEEGSVATPWIPNVADPLYAKMGLDSNVVYDVSGYRNNGTKVGSITYDADTPRYETSAVFDGSSDIRSAKSSFGWFDFKEGTVAAWFKPANTTQTWASVGVQNDGGAGSRSFSICNYSGKAATVVGYDSSWGSSSSGYSMAANTWYHLCATITNGDTVKLYVNGELVQTRTVTNTTGTIASTTQFAVGVDLPGSDERFTGQLSDVRFYTTCLNESDVRDLYAVGASLSNTGVLFSNEVSEL